VVLGLPTPASQSASISTDDSIWLARRIRSDSVLTIWTSSTEVAWASSLSIACSASCRSRNTNAADIEVTLAERGTGSHR
jgi:hypothetical protein